MNTKLIKLTAVLLAAVLLVTAVPFAVSAAEAPQSTGASSGTTGDCTWTLDDNGVLTISGDGEMEDYERPWGSYSEGWGAVTEIIVEDGVTYIGDWAFRDCVNATKAVVADSVLYIGEDAFRGCKKLTDVTLSKNIE